MFVDSEITTNINFYRCAYIILFIVSCYPIHYCGIIIVQMSECLRKFGAPSPSGGIYVFEQRARERGGRIAQ